MATIISKITVGSVLVITVASDPSAGGGTVAPIGSTAYLTDGSGSYYKYAAGDTAWTKQAGVLNTSSLTVNDAGITTFNALSRMFSSMYASSNATSTTIAYSNIVDGAMVTIRYSKTTASNLAITFPAGTVISVSSTGTIAALVLTLNSTAAGEYTISIWNVNGTYKVYVTQDVL